MDKEVFYAHISDKNQYQSARDHCRNAAHYASLALTPIGLSHTAYLAALLHDMGKFKKEFNDYLLDAAILHKPVKRGSVNHTFAGVRFVLNQWHNTDEFGYSEITAELLAFAIGSHHGLFDCIDENRNSGFLYRLEKEGTHYTEASKNFLLQCANQAELNDLFQHSVEEISPVLTKISGLPQQQKDEIANSEIYFYLGLLARMLLSAVIEGDRRDTAEFMDGASFPQWPTNMCGTWSECLCRMEQKLQQFPSDKPIDLARQSISNRCAAFAQRPSGVYRLNVPTGGGKTLSSLRYALAHAKRWNKSRIIFTSPLLSILDQNARIIRTYVGDDHLILEHHSNLVKPSDGNGELNRLELLTESWDCPIIITTLVQLLNVLYSGDTSSIRRFHALCNSIIVIDEYEIIGLNLKSQLNQGFRGLVLFLLTLKIADKAIHRRQYAQNIINALIHRLDAARDNHLTLKMLGFILADQCFQLFDQIL